MIAPRLCLIFELADALGLEPRPAVLETVMLPITPSEGVEPDVGIEPT